MTAASPDHQDSTDLALLRRGDRAAFRRLYDAHVGFVQYVAAQCGRRGMAADDVVQETFWRLFQAAPVLEGRGPLRAWLATTARRLVIDEARRTKREVLGQDAERQAESLADGSEADEREIEIAAVRDLVEEIAALPGGADFKAFYVHGRKARQIAEQNGEAVSTVTMRLSRMRERFRERLKSRLAQLGTRRA